VIPNFQRGMTALAFIVFSFEYAAGAEVTVTLPDVHAAQGSIVELPVRITGIAPSDSIIAYQMKVEFDPGVVTPAGVSVAGTMTERWGDPVSAVSGQIFRVGGFTANQPGRQIVPDGGIFVTLKFLASGEADRFSRIRLTWMQLYDLNGTVAISRMTDGMVSVLPAVRDPWSARLLASGGNETFPLAFGCDTLATDGFDAGLDVLLSPVPPGYSVFFEIASPPITLSTDMRGWALPVVPVVTWTLQAARAEGVSTTLSWDPAELPSRGNFTLSGAGEIDMRTVSSAVFEGSRTLFIRHTLPVTVHYDFPQAGWYMVSLPVIPPDSSVSLLFPAALGGVAFTWDDAAGLYVPKTKMEPKKGYWIAISGSATADAGGQPLFGYIEHFPAQGWHMIGSVWGGANFTAPNDDPDGAALSPAFSWNTAAGAYIPASSLEEKHGYWIAVFQACDLSVGGAPNVLPKIASKDDNTAFHNAFGSMPPPPPDVDWSAMKSGRKPSEAVFIQGYPNPFNTSTTIDYRVSDAGHVSMTVFDALGRVVKKLVDQNRQPGRYKTVWDGKDDRGMSVLSGLYICVMQSKTRHSMLKLFLIR
jgi:hypothetical protein